MLNVRRAKERGHAERGWLTSYHTFSFADYYDPAFMGFHDLRVINEDFIQGGQGFPTHPHKDMEIVTYVVEGELAHRDSMGNSTVIKPGEVQRMSAGTGIQHSEYNSNKDRRTHLLQIWIVPAAKGISPSYGQRSFEDSFAKNALTLTVSRDARAGSIAINQDVDLYVGKWSVGGSVDFNPRPGRKFWVQLVSGQLAVNELQMEPGDGLAITQEPRLQLKSGGSSEFLLFDLA